ncbi:hypothetical protein HanRHA438_Chr13g0610001 [Helianthus annuus]|nr:hypothetical protein HanHA300_Chr13g0491801 [Helianthus annuus]KAJ0498549.1 hypothetical protein HanHA89_Chr13g0523881 [Helianthus annuus]KAJ0664563.1 hypothetical protein HanLR1_Chr13g0493871 [Helianthus annuus]KAJ0672015.1 hypothetical protein HanOQP8_Chr13g0492201 [Helianthus annuus]KAJ0859225.1 hypothetical protein HanRHA438_Chr13g0610001 [Helianthus annuus]
MILSNRQSDACSKESKIRYTSKLERKVKTLQNKANNALYTSDNAPDSENRSSRLSDYLNFQLV